MEMEKNIQVILELKEDGNESELVTYLESLDFSELKKIYTSYYYAKEIEIENYNKTFLEYQENSNENIDYMIMELGQGKTLHALKYYLENITEKIERHEKEIERIREKKYVEEERQAEWKENHDY